MSEGTVRSLMSCKRPIGLVSSGFSEGYSSTGSITEKVVVVIIWYCYISLETTMVLQSSSLVACLPSLSGTGLCASHGVP